MKVGVIGTGTMGKNHARVYSELKGVDELYVFDLNKDNANGMEELDAVVCGSMEELLDNVDGASICVPTKYHLDVAKKAIEKNVHCLIEKPIVESNEIGEGTRIWHFVHIREQASIGENCNIGKSAYIDTEVKIGNNVKIQNFAAIYRGVEIEDDVFVGPSVVFTNDLYPRAFIWGEEKIIPTIVKKGASIGANATIICGVTIGEYAMIGAGSVVTKDVPTFGLVYCIPARLKGFVCCCGKRLSKMIEDAGEKVIYECECGRNIEIKRVDEQCIE